MGVETLRSRETVENIKWKCISDCDWHTVCTGEALVRQIIILCDKVCTNYSSYP